MNFGPRRVKKFTQVFNVFLHSNRLQLLTPFDKWDGKDHEDMTILLKVGLKKVKAKYH